MPTPLLTFLCLVFVALTAQLEAAKRALSEEKVARLVVDQYLVKEKAAQQNVDQSLRASEEAKAALTHGLLSAQASLTATMKKLCSTTTNMKIHDFRILFQIIGLGLCDDQGA
jgi:hypothetical protein